MFFSSLIIIIGLAPNAILLIVNSQKHIFLDISLKRYSYVHHSTIVLISRQSLQKGYRVYTSQPIECRSTLFRDCLTTVQIVVSIYGPTENNCTDILLCAYKQSRKVIRMIYKTTLNSFILPYMTFILPYMTCVSSYTVLVQTLL